MKRLQIVYICIALLIGTYVLLSETGVLPTNCIAATPETDYWMSITSIFTAFGGTFLALRLLAFDAVKKSVEQRDRNKAQRAWLKWNKLRLGIISLAMITNVGLYYTTDQNTTAMYCMLVAFIGFLFCWPSEPVLPTEETSGPRPV